MRENCTVQLKGMHEREDTDNEQLTIHHAGVYRQVNGKDVVSFTENLDKDGHTSKSILKIGDREVELIRKGDVESRLHFVHGENTVTVYNTPFGSMKMNIFAKKVDVRRLDEEIAIVIDYRLTSGNMLLSESKMEINIK